MKFVIIAGPHAVGKMTVGQELAKLTGLKLFHNHMTIDLVTQFFEFSHPEARRLIALFRQEIFEAVANSELPGMIFTYMWAFDLQSDWDYIAKVTSLFEARGAEIYIVELEADYQQRLQRNRTENRLAHKPTKRDLERSEKTFVTLEEAYRLNSNPGEVHYKNYLRIDNTNMAPRACAERIAHWMSLSLSPATTDLLPAINDLIFDSEAYWGEGDSFMSAFKARYSITQEWLINHAAYCVHRGEELVGFMALDMPPLLGIGSEDSSEDASTATEFFEVDSLNVYLEYFYVRADQIGTGLGRWLWAQLMGICRQQGIHQLTWITSPGAEGFYLRQGARRIGTVQSTLRAGREIPKLTVAIR